MCIAIYKPAGVDTPTKKLLKTCFTNNPDGAGFMLANNGKVHIEKGFMSFNALKKALKVAEKRYGNFKEIPVVYHFRITTQGGVQKELCHPFPLSNSYDEMRKLSGDYDMAIAHNGIISLTSNYGVKDHNDTMEFIKEIAYPAINNKMNYYKNNNIMGMLDYLLYGNRFVILNGDGHAELIGSWVEDNGVFYSNTSYKEVKSTFKKISDFDVCAWNKSFGVKTTKKLKSAKLNSKQKEDLRYMGEVYCDECGALLELDYDYETETYYAFCPDCAKFYELDDEDVWDWLESESYDYYEMGYAN